MADPIKPTGADEAMAARYNREFPELRLAQAFALRAQQAREQALEEAAMLIETGAFRTDEDNPPHEIWTHGFEAAREVFSTIVRAIKGKRP